MHLYRLFLNTKKAVECHSDIFRSCASSATWQNIEHEVEQARRRLGGLGAKRSHGSLGVRPKPVRSSAENGSAVRSQIAVKVASLWSNVEYPCHKPAERTRRCCAPMYVQPRCHNYTRRRIP